MKCVPLFCFRYCEESRLKEVKQVVQYDKQQKDEAQSTGAIISLPKAGDGSRAICDAHVSLQRCVCVHTCMHTFACGGVHYILEGLHSPT